MVNVFTVTLSNNNKVLVLSLRAKARQLPSNHFGESTPCTASGGGCGCSMEILFNVEKHQPPSRFQFHSLLCSESNSATQGVRFCVWTMAGALRVAVLAYHNWIPFGFIERFSFSQLIVLVFWVTLVLLPFSTAVFSWKYQVIVVYFVANERDIPFRSWWRP